ncbi:GMC family oxidoreductase [Streptomyces sp. NPDC093586]|uniref:GMC family oxidoreductase n=1 Tax=Streptomyces sp. NPDC093586 TaxID=3366042 RepID=UPI003819F237
MSSKKLVDYIIVGAGAAGSALAQRLGANPHNRVLVIEAGGTDEHPHHRMPAPYAQEPTRPRYRDQHAPQPLAVRRLGHRRMGGLIAGGSTAASGTGRGGEADHDMWETPGVTGWNRARFLGAYTAMERHAARATGPHDDRGRQPAEVVSPPDAATELWIRALARWGIDTEEDVDEGPEVTADLPRSMPTGAWTSTFRTLARRRARRRNVRVRSHCTARRILFDGTTAIGVEAETPRGTTQFTARREIILCAGAVGSSLLLERSGVGDPEVLTTAGVHLVAANPAVGSNLRQRRGAAFTLRLDGVPDRRDPKPVTPAARLKAKAGKVLRRAEAQRGGDTSVLAVLDSQGEASGPDMELLFTSTPVADRDGDGAGGTGRPEEATVTFCPQSSTSVGSLHITGPTLQDPPRLVPGYLSTDQDKERTVAAFTRAREILATEPFASVMTETFPGTDVVDPEAVLRYVLDHGVTVDAVGTCALGTDGVVDDELRVRGTHRLRVADASVMPALTTGDTEATSMAVGWIAGDILRNANTRSR